MSDSAEYNLEFTANDDEVLEMVMKDDQKNIIDLTGCAARLHIRGSLSGAILVSKTAVIDGVNGSVKFTFDAADTGALNPDPKPLVCYVYDIELTWAGGEVETPVYGNIIVKGDVTR